MTPASAGVSFWRVSCLAADFELTFKGKPKAKE
jgi:hypothetical protein